MATSGSSALPSPTTALGSKADIEATGARGAAATQPATGLRDRRIKWTVYLSPPHPRCASGGHLPGQPRRRRHRCGARPDRRRRHHGGDEPAHGRRPAGSCPAASTSPPPGPTALSSATRLTVPRAARRANQGALLQYMEKHLHNITS